MEAMPSVLLVSLEPATLAPVAAELAVAGIRAKTVSDFEQAIEQVSARPYEIAIIVVEPPRLEGAGIVQDLKRRRPGMACIVAAPSPSREDVLHTLSAGALAYVGGPINAVSLVELVKERRRHDLSTTEDALDVRVEEADGAPVLYLNGDLDLVTAPLLQRRIDELLGAGHDRLLVDADSLGFCDSTGLRLLLSARRRLAERSGELLLLRTSGVLQRLLDLSGLAPLMRRPTSTAAPRDP